MALPPLLQEAAVAVVDTAVAAPPIVVMTMTDLALPVQNAQCEPFDWDSKVGWKYKVCARLTTVGPRSWDTFWKNNWNSANMLEKIWTIIQGFSLLLLFPPLSGIRHIRLMQQLFRLRLRRVP